MEEEMFVEIDGLEVEVDRVLWEETPDLVIERVRSARRALTIDADDPTPEAPKYSDLYGKD